MANMADHSNRLAKLEAKVEANTQIIRALSTKFAYYWANEGKRKCFAVISRLNKDVAELIVFSSGWSGGCDIITDCEMFISNPTIPEDEQVHLRDGKWEPMLELPEILDEAIEQVERVLTHKKPETDEDETSTSATDSQGA